MTVRVRFAPSPTGELHVGNARTALFNWLFARQQGGEFVLRVEDTDVERSETRFEEQLIKDLQWLGLDWNEGPDVGGPYGPYRQSERAEAYQQYAQKLIAAGSAYYCFCSSQEIELERKAALTAGRQPRYSGKCSKLDPETAKARKEAGEPASVRLRIPNHPFRFEDLVHGLVEFTQEVIGDPILVRSSGLPAYNFAVVIDDALMRITHVIRGDDHISNTPRQLAVYGALAQLPRQTASEPDWNPPQFAHLSTILGPDHTRLSKRHGATSLGHFRAAGILPEALANYLALLGWAPSQGNREIFTLPELIQSFSLKEVSRNPAVFDMEKLRWLNRHYLKQSNPERILNLAIPILQQAGYIGESPDESALTWWREVLDLLLPSVGELSQLPAQAAVLFEYDAGASLQIPANNEVISDAAARQVVEAFAEKTLENSELSADRLREVLEQVKLATQQKGKNLFHPIRIALTGTASGPQLDRLIPLVEAGSRLELPKPIKSCRSRLMEFHKALRGI
ncbi:MAG: glutamate--tRNA ligase [Acidobacteria bacterium]|nr:glutamate--tRNA ligase [Acidobacteriota bacterium]